MMFPLGYFSLGFFSPGFFPNWSAVPTRNLPTSFSASVVRIDPDSSSAVSVRY